MSVWCNEAWGILIFMFSPYSLIAPVNMKLVTNKCHSYKSCLNNGFLIKKKKNTLAYLGDRVYSRP